MRMSRRRRSRSPLYELAEALLSNRHKDFSMLNKLLGENEGLTLEKV